MTYVWTVQDPPEEGGSIYGVFDNPEDPVAWLRTKYGDNITTGARSTDWFVVYAKGSHGDWNDRYEIGRYELGKPTE